MFACLFEALNRIPEILVGKKGSNWIQRGSMEDRSRVTTNVGLWNYLQGEYVGGMRTPPSYFLLVGD
jgi:hypothetical protein